MTEREPEQRGKGASFYVGIVLGVLVLYPLSVGPVGYALRSGILPASAQPYVADFYRPIGWATAESPWLHGWYDWWRELWSP